MLSEGGDGAAVINPSGIETNEPKKLHHTVAAYEWDGTPLEGVERGGEGPKKDGGGSKTSGGRATRSKKIGVGRCLCIFLGPIDY